MQPSSKAGAEEKGASSSLLSRWFPTPQLLVPRAVGVDISDASIKWLALAPDGKYRKVVGFGDEPLKQGIVVEGTIHDIPALAHALKDLKSKWKNIDCANAALPEEAAYVFSMHIPAGANRDQALKMIEFELENRVPIPPSAAVYDYNVIVEHDGDAGSEIGVVVFPKELAESYVEVFEGAGITLLSLEVEARSIARAVASSEVDDPITLLVDFGRARTGFAVLKRGVPIFTSTVAVGGNAISKVLEEKFNMRPQDIENIKDNEGLYADPKAVPALDAMTGAANALADEVTKHYHYWDTRRNERGERMTPVGRVLLVGGSANLRGLDDFIAGKVQAETQRGNIWKHVCDLSDYVPPIDRRTSLQYATAMGLALRSM